MIQPTVHRVEVRPRPGTPDARGQAVASEAASVGVPRPPQRIETAGVYLIEGPLTQPQVQRIADELLADPVTEHAILGASPAKADATIEIHPLPGVMDPEGENVELAIDAMLGVDVTVRTGRRYDLHATDGATARIIAARVLANTLIHAIHEEPYFPTALPRGAPYELKIVTISLRDRSDAELEKLSRDAHLFLSLDEMKAVQAHFRQIGRDPREIELETIAQTWSEHCVHKTLKATIRYREEPGTQSPRIVLPGRPGHTVNPDGSITIHNLLKSTVAAATHELIEDGIDWCLSVFIDNAGVIAFDDEHAVCFKCETHNHPSALEPYGGAATGIGGCIRDIVGTGLAAQPIAATDVFCVAYPDRWKLAAEDTEGTEGEKRADVGGTQIAFRNSSSPSVPSVSSVVHSLPRGVLHPRRVLTQVVAGVRDYGNRMGIPTLNGAVWFHDDYVANPLVFCGCIGVMPRDKVRGKPQPGDRIVALGGRTGRDGIHGATFSSAELTDTHAAEFSHAVQIGNAITEKKLLDAIMAAREWWPDAPPRDAAALGESSHAAERRATGATCIYHAITDCGAGGFSSAVGEMGADLGAAVHLDRAPLKYAGLSPTEIWISEAQERMVLAVPPENLEALRAICAAHDVEMAELGEFGTPNGELILYYRNTEVGKLSMGFLHEGLPEVMREAVWAPNSPSLTGREFRGGSDPPSTPGPPGPPGSSPTPVLSAARERETGSSTRDALLALLAHPTIASKHWIIRQYDHEVQGRSVIKPLVGERGDGPSDAALIVPVPDSTRGLAIANGLATGLHRDPYVMALAAIDECVRNLVCVGADPSRIAILDNFCWPGCNDPQQLGALVRAAEACYDGAKAYRTPFISGKDSLNNQFTAEDGRTIRIPPTLLISGIGIVPDVRGAVTMDAKRAENLLVLVGETHGRMGGSHYEMIFGGDDAMPVVDLERGSGGPGVARAAHRAIAAGLVASAHDVSDGGLLVAAAEMAMAGGLGLDIDPPGAMQSEPFLFSEAPSRYLLEISPDSWERLEKVVEDVPIHRIGRFNDSARLTSDANGVDVSLDELRRAWRGTLDW